MNLIHNPPSPPLHETPYNNIFQENEVKPTKHLKRNEKNKNKKIGFKKQQFFNNNNNNINNQPQQYYNNTISVNTFNFEPSQPPPLNYGMLPPPPWAMYQVLAAVLSSVAEEYWASVVADPDTVAAVPAVATVQVAEPEL